MFLAVPGLPLMLLVGALLRPGTVEIALIIGFVGWPAAARLLRAQVLSLRHRGFVLAARGFGGSTRYLVRRHLFPAVSPVVSAGFLQWAATAVLLEAGLAFLGVGDPTATSWGRMLEQGVTHQGMYTDWQWVWLLAPPGLAITLTVAGFALVGLGLEPILDPRLRRLA
jgi:peptide/nickel transport system permease protein